MEATFKKCLIISFQNFSADFEKAFMQNTAFF